MDAEPAERHRETPGGRGEQLALAALLAAIALAGALPRYIPTHDGPQHVFAVHVANHLADGARGWSDWLEIAHPVTSLGFSALFSPLDLLLPWPLALRVALTGIALLWAIAVYAFARAVSPGRGWLGIALGGAAYSWAFYMGFFSFQVASAAGLGVLAWAFARPPTSARATALASAMLGVVALLHVFSAFVTGVVLAALLWFRAAPGERAATCARIAVIALPGAGVALALLSVGIEDMAVWNDQGVADFLWRPTPWWALGKGFAGGPVWRAWPLALLALAAPLVALRQGVGALRPEDRALLAGGAALLAAGLLLPLDLPAWDLFSLRFLPLGTCALVLALPLERLAAPRRTWAAGALAAFGLAATAWAGWFHAALQAETADALSGLDAPIARRGMRLPIVLEPDVAPTDDEAYANGPAAPMPFSLPLVNLGQLYSASQGGLTPYAFVLHPRMHHLLVREDARPHAPAEVDRGYVADLIHPDRGDDRDFRHALLTHLAARGAGFEDVIFYGRPEEADHLRALGFVEDWRQGGLSIARFRGCPVTVSVSPDAARTGAGLLEVGWYPSWHATARYPLARGDAAPDGARTLRLRQTCDAMWLRLVDAPVPCAGADAEGRLLVRATRETPHVVCRLPEERWAAPTPGSGLARRAPGGS